MFARYSKKLEEEKEEGEEISMLNIRMSRTPIEGSPVPGVWRPGEPTFWCGRGSSSELLSAFIPIGDTEVEIIGWFLLLHHFPSRSHTRSFREIETTIFDPASVFLSTHWWSQKPASQFLPKETCSFYKRDIFRRFSAHPASGFLKHIGRNWPNPGCSFYLPVSISRNDPVGNYHDSRASILYATVLILRIQIREFPFLQWHSYILWYIWQTYTNTWSTRWGDCEV